MEFRKNPTPDTYSTFLAKNADLRDYGGQIGAFMGQAAQIEDSFYDSPHDPQLKSAATNVVGQDIPTDHQYSDDRRVWCHLWDTDGFWHVVPQHHPDAVVPANSH